ncbi:MAG: zinc ribbon domain-containing protein [Methanobacteriota archaeon]|nr:MAG: zinc ribbon domain-containing protein [Euryarchaeota archaeon]
MSEAQSQQPRNCVSCGRSISWDANVCPYCGHDFRAVMAAPGQTQKKDSAMPLVGGILIIIASIMYFIGGGLMVAGGALWSWADVGEGAAAVVCGAVVLVLGILALLGGIFATQKKNFVLALLAGILTIPSILGLIGLILVAVSKDEFGN